MTEEWRPVPDLEGRYEVSSLGRVRSLLGRTPRVLKGSPVAKGKRHLGVMLYHTNVFGGRTAWLVHRLVLTVFEGPPPFPKARALHKNDVADDNRIENLYWGTDSDNQNDRVANGYKHSEETKRRISESTQGREPWNKGKKVSDHYKT